MGVLKMFLCGHCNIAQHTLQMGCTEYILLPGALFREVSQDRERTLGGISLESDGRPFRVSSSGWLRRLEAICASTRSEYPVEGGREGGRKGGRERRREGGRLRGREGGRGKRGKCKEVREGGRLRGREVEREGG